MEIKKYEGQLSMEEYAAGLLNRFDCKTLGSLWEQHVKCQNCSQREACNELSDEMMTQHNINLTCRQVIDILLGDLKIETLINGGNK
jgi:hypothetical protein